MRLTRFICSWTGLLAICLMCLLLVAPVGCRKNTAANVPAAPVTTLDKLSAAAYQIANALDSGEKEFEALYGSNIPGVSDDGYAKTVAGIFLKAIEINQEYTARLRSLTTIDASNRGQVIAWSTELIGSLDRLMNEGVLGIKNPDARARISQILDPIPGAVNTIAAALGMDTSQPRAAVRATQFFTEVNFDTGTNRPDGSARHTDRRATDRILVAHESGAWPYRSTIARRGRPDQRPGQGPDGNFPQPAECRRLIPIWSRAAYHRAANLSTPGNFGVSRKVGGPGPWVLG